MKMSKILWFLASFLDLSNVLVFAVMYGFKNVFVFAFIYGFKKVFVFAFI